MTLLSAVPVLPVSNIERAVDYYVTRLGFQQHYTDDDYGILSRDEVRIHVWAANKPDVSGAEPELAGTASCRVVVDDIQAFYDELAAKDLVHPLGSISDHPWGREFAVLDLDRNAIMVNERR
jgi:catechol 2,3-dioxygenase-like lactoylglutathione lyase family enzyme